MSNDLLRTVAVILMVAVAVMVVGVAANENTRLHHYDTMTMKVLRPNLLLMHCDPRCDWYSQVTITNEIYLPTQYYYFSIGLSVRHHQLYIKCSENYYTTPCSPISAHPSSANPRDSSYRDTSGANQLRDCC